MTKQQAYDILINSIGRGLDKNAAYDTFYEQLKAIKEAEKKEEIYNRKAKLIDIKKE